MLKKLVENLLTLALKFNKFCGTISLYPPPTTHRNHSRKCLRAQGQNLALAGKAANHGEAVHLYHVRVQVKPAGQVTGPSHLPGLAKWQALTCPLHQSVVSSHTAPTSPPMNSLAFLRCPSPLTPASTSGPAFLLVPSARIKIRGSRWTAATHFIGITAQKHSRIFAMATAAPAR